jgi:hypothetical protein
VVGVCEEREGQPVLLPELDVRVLVVGGDAEHDGAGTLELAVGVPDPARLRRAAGRVVLGIEVEDDRLAAQAGERHLLAGIASEREVGCRLAFSHIHRFVLLVPRRAPVGPLTDASLAVRVVLAAPRAGAR